jgi:hypothetical protein
MKKLQSIALFAAVSLISTAASAAGGLATGTTAVTDFKTWFVALLAIMAVVYLGAKGVQLATDKIQWADFGQSVMKTAAAGGATALAAWAYFLF